MSNNPFSKIPVPTKADPRVISVSDFSKYQSFEMNKLSSSLRTYRKSLLYIGGTVALSLVFAWISNKKASHDLFGADCNYIITFRSRRILFEYENIL